MERFSRKSGQCTSMSRYCYPTMWVFRGSKRRHTHHAPATGSVRKRWESSSWWCWSWAFPASTFPVRVASAPEPWVACSARASGGKLASGSFSSAEIKRVKIQIQISMLLRILEITRQANWRRVLWWKLRFGSWGEKGKMGARPLCGASGRRCSAFPPSTACRRVEFRRHTRSAAWCSSPRPVGTARWRACSWHGQNAPARSRKSQLSKKAHTLCACKANLFLCFCVAFCWRCLRTRWSLLDQATASDTCRPSIILALRTSKQVWKMCVVVCT